MGTGLKRREVVTDTLAGEALVTPARLQGPGIQAPRAPAVQSTATADIAAALGKWASNELTEVANKEHERALMDGAIASVQGKTFDQLQLDGADKWSLQGHRLITSQTMAAGLTAAQTQLIEDSAYALGPDEYRDQLTQQTEMMTEGQDPRTARLIRERMTEASVELVAKQTMAHANHNEQMTYESLVQGIAAQSTDTMTQESMLSFVAGGPGTASGSLSDARRKQAIMEGVVLSFVQDNPKAYSLIKSAGLMNDMTTDQLNRINDAETQFQNRLRTEYNGARLDAHKALDAEVAAGDPNLTPQVVQDKRIAIETEHGIQVRQNEAKAYNDAAIQPWATATTTRWLTAETARANGDWKAFGAATEDLVVWAESRGNPDAVSEDGAEGLFQVMPPTQGKPGFGLRPSDGTQKDTVRLGREYWAMMLSGTGGDFGNLLVWDSMDVEAAAIAYNAGHTRAKAWIEAGRDYSVFNAEIRGEVEPYAKSIKKAYDDQEAPLGPQRYNRALHDKTEANKIADAEVWSLASREIQKQDEKFTSGDIDEQTWRKNNRDILSAYEVDLTKSIVAHENAVTKGMADAAQRLSAKSKVAAEKARIDGAMRIITEEMIGPDAEFKLAMESLTLSPAQRRAAWEKHAVARDQAYARNGLPIISKSNTTAAKAGVNAMIDSIPPWIKHTREQARIDRARADGSIASLPQNLKDRERQQSLEQSARDGMDAHRKSGGGPDADQAYSDHMTSRDWASFEEIGEVHKDYRESESSNLRDSGLVNDEGEVSEQAVSSIKRYIEFSKQQPELAHQFYNEKELAFANAVISVAAATGDLEQAVFDVNKMKVDEVIATKGMDEFLKSARTQAAIAKHVDEMRELNDTSLLQASVNSDVDLEDPFGVLRVEQDARDAQLPLVADALEHELALVAALQPGVPVEHLIDTALGRLERRSAFIGQSYVYTDKNIRQEMFGARANQYAEVNVEHKAFVRYYADMAQALGHNEITEVGFVEFFPRAVQPSTIAGFDIGFDRGLSTSSAVEAQIRGLRAMVSGVNARGEMYVRFLNDEGNLGTLIPADLELIGKYWMHVNPNFRNDAAGDPISNPKKASTDATVFQGDAFDN